MTWNNCSTGKGKVSERWKLWKILKDVFKRHKENHQLLQVSHITSSVVCVLTLELLDLGGVLAGVSATLLLSPSPSPWTWLRSAKRARSCGTVMVLLSPWRASRSWSTWAGGCVSLSPCPVTWPRGDRSTARVRANIIWDWRRLNGLLARPWQDQISMASPQGSRMMICGGRRGRKWNIESIKNGNKYLL